MPFAPTGAKQPERLPCFLLFRATFVLTPSVIPSEPGESRNLSSSAQLAIGKHPAASYFIPSSLAFLSALAVPPLRSSPLTQLASLAVVSSGHSACSVFGPLYHGQAGTLFRDDGIRPARQRGLA